MSSNPRWMITGTTGLLGANAARSISRKEPVVGVARTAPSSIPIPFFPSDLSNAESREGLLEKIQPDVVLHCAAIASHEYCEANPAAARALNVEASEDLAAQAARIGAKFVYISTDAVFNGEKGNYKETDDPSPNSVYGNTKLDGENAVLSVMPHALVARVNFFGWSPTGSRSLAEFFVRNLERGEAVPGFSDVRVSTLYVGLLVDRIVELVAANAEGIFHVANDESITKFEFGQRVANFLEVDPSLVLPASSREVLELARGSDLSLDTKKLRETTGQSSDQHTGLEKLFLDRKLGVGRELKAYAEQLSTSR